jgi:hypothetical protein
MEVNCDSPASICRLLLSLGAARGGPVRGRASGDDSARERKGTSGHETGDAGWVINSSSPPGPPASPRLVHPSPQVPRVGRG